MEEELVWTITWCRAFPTLLPTQLYSNKIDESIQLLAFEAIFSNQNKRKDSVYFGRVVEGDKNAREYSQLVNSHCPAGLENNLGYGEITPQAVMHVMRQCGTSNVRKFNRKQKVVDLGSGNGLVLFAAALACPFEEALGIEILPDLHRQATDNLALWQDWSVSSDLSTTRFEFHCDDFTKYDISDASFVWVHATVFDQKLMHSVQKMCETCASGTYFVMVSKPLKHVNGIGAIKSLQLQMNWGEATVYIQKKL